MTFRCANVVIRWKVLSLVLLSFATTVVMFFNSPRANLKKAFDFKEDYSELFRNAILSNPLKCPEEFSIIFAREFYLSTIVKRNF